MKRFFVALFAVALLACACDKYDDSALQNRMTTLEGRVTALESAVNQINGNVASLQTLIKALQDEITIDVISQTKDGYTITFSDGVSVTIANGQAGAQGPKGDKGDKGEAGANGSAPVIGVKSDAGVYYWTVDGEWLLGEDGAKVPVTGAAPQVKIEDGFWYVSYDGATWTKLGEATAPGTSDFAVSEDANFVYFTMKSTGETIKISKSSRFTLDIPGLDYIISAGATTEIPYSIYGADGTERVFAQSAEFAVKVDASKIYVTSKEGVTTGEVLVMAVRNSDQAVCGVALSFSEGVFEVSEAQKVAAAGGEVSFTVKTNVDYEVIIPAEATWLALAPETKAVREDVVKLVAQPNEGAARFAKVEVKPAVGTSLFVTVAQDAPAPDSPYKVVTIAELIAAPEDAETVYQLTGVITAIKNSVEGNFEMKDATGTIYVVGLKTAEGENAISAKGLENGDQVTLHGTRYNTGSSIRVANAVYDSHIKAGDIPVVIETVTIAEFLAKPASTDVWYQLTGKISDISNKTYGNFYLEDETGKVYVYGLTATKVEKNDKSFASLGLKNGDTLTAIGLRSDYFNATSGETTIEFGGDTPAYYVSHVPGEGGGTPGGEATGDFASSLGWTCSQDNAAYDDGLATVNGEEGIETVKLGTSKKGGSFTLIIPAGVTKIGFYAVAWKGNATSLTVDGETVSIAANDGASGNAPYTIEVDDSDYYTFDVSAGSIEISCPKRAILFGFNPAK